MLRNVSAVKSELEGLVTVLKSGNATEAQIRKTRELTAELTHAIEAEKGDQMLARLAKAANGAHDMHPEGKRFTRSGLKTTATELATNVKAHAAEAKAAVTVGSFHAPIKLEEPTLMGTAPLGLLEAVPVTTFDDKFFSYLRQSSRALNAAVVPEGQLKPVSPIGLERVEGATQVVAHTSDPVDEMLLADVPSVAAVVGHELLYGLHSAVEHQFLSGAGTGQLHGILAADGIQVVDAGGRPMDRIRTALTRLTMQGYAARVVVLSPADWEAMELATTSGSGEYVLNGGPVDSSAQRLWGVPVSLSTAVPVGTAVVLDTDHVALATTGNVNLHVGQPGDTFNRNQVVFRAEGRFETMLRQPMAVVKVTLTDS